MTEIKSPKEMLLDRATKLDLEVWAELNDALRKSRLWMYEPPVSTMACSNGPGLLFLPTSTPRTWVIVTYNYTRNSAGEKRLDAAQKVLEDAGYAVRRDGAARMLVRVEKATS
jgi:hypothetical protein